MGLGSLSRDTTKAFEQVEDWMMRPSPKSRVFAIIGSKGIGKTAIGAQLASRDFVAAHFFRQYEGNGDKRQGQPLEGMVKAKKHLWYKKTAA